MFNPGALLLVMLPHAFASRGMSRQRHRGSDINNLLDFKRYGSVLIKRASETASSTSASANSAVSSSASSDDTQPSPERSREVIRTAGIVGSVVAVVILLGLALMLLFHYRNRRRRALKRPHGAKAFAPSLPSALPQAYTPNSPQMSHADLDKSVPLGPIYRAQSRDESRPDLDSEFGTGVNRQRGHHSPMVSTPLLPSAEQHEDTTPPSWATASTLSTMSSSGPAYPPGLLGAPDNDHDGQFPQRSLNHKQ